MNPILPVVYALGGASGLALLVTYIQSRQTQGDPDMKLSDFFHALETVAPVVLSLVPGVPPVLVPVIQHGIQVAEGMPGATGEQKKAAALDLVNTGITATNAAAGKQVIDPSVINAVSNGIDTTIGVVNILHKAPVAADADLAKVPAPAPAPQG